MIKNLWNTLYRNDAIKKWASNLKTDTSSRVSFRSFNSVLFLTVSNTKTVSVSFFNSKVIVLPSNLCSVLCRLLTKAPVGLGPKIVQVVYTLNLLKLMVVLKIGEFLCSLSKSSPTFGMCSESGFNLCQAA